MNRRTSLLAASVALLAATALGAHAQAGAILPKSQARLTIEASMGIRILTTTAVQAGPNKYDAQVVDAERFASRGFPNAKVNDKVTIHILGDKKGKVVHEKSANAHVFDVTDDGKVSKAD